nr:hypothetical protein [Tanacetum cinerariifolium]
MNGYRECCLVGLGTLNHVPVQKGDLQAMVFIKHPTRLNDPLRFVLSVETCFDGHYCRHCALLRKKLKEVWFKICDEQNFFQDFLNTSESSNEDSNVVNAPQEPFVFNQNPREYSLQSPLQINHQCCYGCSDSLDEVFCRRCTCESYGNGAHIGYNCPPKVSVVSNPEPCHNQKVDELPQTLTNFHPTCYSGDEDSFNHDSTPNFDNDSPNIFHPPPQTPTNSYEFCGNDAHYNYDCPPQFQFIYNSEPCYNQDFNFLQNFQIIQQQCPCCERCGGPHENFQCQQVIFYEACCGNCEAWDRVFEIKNAVRNKQYKSEDVQELFCKLLSDVQNIHEELADHDDDDDDDDDENCIIAITLDEPDNSLSMGDEHLDTISATESDKVIKSSVEDLVLIPSESEGIPDNTCDVPFRDNSPPLDISEDQFEEFFGSNDDSASIDDDYFSIDNIDYIELSPPDYEPVSLEGVKDDNLREKLMNINLLIAKIKSLNDKPILDHVLKSSILVEDSDSFLEKSDTSLSYSDNSLPEFEKFSNHTEETNSGNTTTHVDYSLSKYDSFLFEIEPDQGDLTSVVILAEPRVRVPNVLTHPTLMLDSDFIPSDNSLPEFGFYGLS